MDIANTYIYKWTLHIYIYINGHYIYIYIMSIFIVVVELLSHVQLYDSMDCRMPGFLVLHHLPEFAQTHVH